MAASSAACSRLMAEAGREKILQGRGLYAEGALAGFGNIQIDLQNALLLTSTVPAVR